MARPAAKLLLSELPIPKLEFDPEWAPVQPGSAEVSKQGQKAYFKSLASGHGQYPHGVLEFVGWTLGSLVGVPVAELRPAQLIDQTRGSVSLWPPQPFARWDNFPALLTAAETINRFGDPKCFAALLVFDVWLGNMDRHNTNLIYRELDTKPWEPVLIDHGHIFANGQWANNLADINTPVSPANLVSASFIRQDNAKLSQVFAILLTHEAGLLCEIAHAISSVADETIVDAIMQIPNDFATDEQLTAISSIVILRKNRLEEIFRG